MTTNIKERIREEWRKYITSTLPEPLEEGEKILSMSVDFGDCEDWWLSKLDQAVKEREDEIVEKIEQYFEGLIAMPNPQASKENIINLIKEK